MSKEAIAEEEVVNEQSLSPEEMEAKRVELMEFYESELPLMRVRAEYEKLATEIEEARFGRLQIRIAHAQMLQGPAEPDMSEMPPEFREAMEREMAENPEGSESSGKTGKKRTLKKQD